MEDHPLWHSLSVSETLSRLKSGADKGLSLEETVRRLEKVGRNVLSPPHRTPSWRRFLAQFENPLIIILLVSAGASAIAGRTTDAAVIVAVTIVNAVIGFVQEMKAQGAIDALAKMVKTECMVMRHGEKPVRISAEELVPGDIVLLATGDRVPADLRLLETKNLQINESALTGESVPAQKHADIVDSASGIGDRRNIGFTGSLVTVGSGRGVVVETGDHTELGKINALLNATEDLNTPLMDRLEVFSKVFGIWVVGFGVLIFVIGIMHGGTKTDMFMAAVSAAVGAIPEGLPAVMTIVLAIGVKNMASRNAIIRKLPAVETLGSVTVICSDKTGTLTANEMTVQRVLTVNAGYTADGVGFNPALGKLYGPDDRVLSSDVDLQRLLKGGVLCNDAQLVCKPHGVEVEGDPTEGALITVAAKAGIDPDRFRRAFPRFDIQPFDSASQIMTTLNREEDGTMALWVKGSAEKLLPMCDRQSVGAESRPFDAKAILAQVDELAAQGMRVLAFAWLPFGDRKTIPDALPALSFIGLQAMIDPPRSEVRESLAICQRAGIDVKMITGDHLATATAIARDLGIGRPGIPGVRGQELADGTAEQLSERAEAAAVFARVAPEHKFKLVEALQRKRHIVAMTGDGVNDAPALKRADIGVAMGLSGTEVAKEAADMILVDDNFATLVRAVEEGRNVFNNLVKSMVYILPTNTAQGLVLLFAVLCGLKELPVTPVQVLWVNLLTAFLSLPLAFEAMESGLMEKKPRHPDQPLLETTLVWRIVAVAVLMTLVSFLIFYYETDVMGRTIEVARTSVVATMVGVELFYVFPARGLWAQMPGFGPTLNPVLWPCIFATIAAQLAFTYVPFFQKMMGSTPMDLEAWAVILAMSAIVIPLVETIKRWTAPKEPPERDELEPAAD
ncbi:MAG: HAD-IC family P-type ATPase [Candidatus Ozemobacteraceae bacterium]